MFWVYLKIPVILRILGIPSGLKYTLGSQVYLRVSGITLGLRYTLRFIFWLYLKIPTSFQVPNIPPNIKYTSRSQIHVAIHILNIFEGTYNLLSPKYIFGFQVYPRVPDILPGPRYTPSSQVHSWVSYTFSGLSYIFGSQVHIVLYVLGIFEDICYLLSFKYIPRSQVHPQVSSIHQVSIYTFESLNNNNEPTMFAEKSQESMGIKYFYFGP